MISFRKTSSASTIPQHLPFLKAQAAYLTTLVLTIQEPEELEGNIRLRDGYTSMKQVNTSSPARMQLTPGAIKCPTDALKNSGLPVVC
jgi:hypothetical protein